MILSTSQQLQEGTVSQVIRVLGRRRLSREQVASTSMDRQESYIVDWCEEQTRVTGVPHVVIGWADDVDVSGAIDPFKTEGLGPWLTDERAAEWDVLACWKIDRLSRTTLNSYKLLVWCKDRGKRIKATNDLIDPDSRVGELLWFIISWLAEGELEAIQDRTSDAREWLVKTDRFPGGPAPYGYVSVPHPDGEGYTLSLDPGMVRIIYLMIEWITVEGYSRSKVARALNDMEIPGPYKGRGYKPRGNKPSSLNGEWSTQAVERILRSKNLLGIRTHNGEVVLHDSTGLPVLFGEPVISHTAYVELQEALNRTMRPRTEVSKSDPSSLPEIAMCGVCGNRMYRNISGTGTRRAAYFVCSAKRGTKRLSGVYGCLNRAAKYDYVWNHLETYLLDELGDKPWEERKVTEGRSNSEEVKKAKAAMALLVERVANLSPGAMEVFDTQIAALDERIRTLSALPDTNRRVTWVATGKTFREHWESLTLDQRVTLLNAHGSYVSVLRWPGQLTSPALRPDLPAIDFGGIKYALIPGDDRSHTLPQIHVTLGGHLLEMLRG